VEWTSTGLYALPGKPFTVQRPLGFTSANLSVRVAFQKKETSRSLEKSGAYTMYDRPSYLQSPELPVAAGGSRTVTSPYGGPIYLYMGGSAATVGQTASLSFTNVAKHAALLDTADSAAVAQFPDGGAAESAAPY
jgi:immunomodulating metalloprotease